MSEQPSKDQRTFKPGQHVRYVPNHAHGDPAHADCENGVVTSVTEHCVFVRFRGPTGEACKPEQLR